ncbi:hypothetical protein E2C01_045411 [Portunus trituberculatus]|uniref:Uncharacterized protein n=1 Tax=Portunus trituberculatus TaxID=210409 RepID=A0A5B7FVP8_PORTR|nr:hypothetical protein [Portunus trituberculatus]
MAPIEAPLSNKTRHGLPSTVAPTRFPFSISTQQFTEKLFVITKSLVIFKILLCRGSGSDQQLGVEALRRPPIISIDCSCEKFVKENRDNVGCLFNFHAMDV